MTDSELLELVQSKSVRELAPADIEILLERVARSQEVRDFFGSRLKWQHYLADAKSRSLAEVNRESGPDDKRRTCAVGILAVGSLAVIGVLLAGFVLAFRPASESREWSDGRSRDRDSAPAAEEIPNKLAPGKVVAAQTELSSVERVTGSVVATPISGTREFPEPETALPEFYQVRFPGFDPVNSIVRVKRWFEPVDAAGEWIEEHTRFGHSVGFDGLFRLRAAWEPGTALRLGLASAAPLQIHLYRGRRGVTFVHHPEGWNRWSAYVTRWDADRWEPTSLSLASTDEGRADRTGFQLDRSFALHCAKGTVVLSRGDVRLASAPLPESPTTLLIDGRVLLHGLDRVNFADSGPRTAMLPTHHSTRPLPKRRLTLPRHRERPAAPPRRETDSSWYSIAEYPRHLPGELVLVLDRPVSESGIWLGTADGDRLVSLQYSSEIKGGLICLAAGGDDDLVISGRARPLPAVTGRHYVRLVVGSGIVSWWLGQDGTAWGKLGQPLRIDTTRISHWGVYSADERGALKVHEVRFNEFAAVQLPVAEDWLTASLTHASVGGYADWKDVTASSRPPELLPEQWSAACALGELAAGRCGHYADRLVELLLDESIRRGLPAKAQLELLNQSSLLLDLTRPEVQDTLQRGYRRVGLELLDRDAPQPFSTCRWYLHHLSLAGPIALQMQHGEMAVAELLRYMHEERWEQASRFCEMLRFFHFDVSLPIYSWATSQIAKQLPEAGSFTFRQRGEWRDLWVQRVDKSSYEAVARMRSEVRSARWVELASRIMKLERRTSGGLAPSLDDSRLMMLPRVFVGDLYARFRPLREALQGSVVDVAEMRVNEAMKAADPTEVDFAASLAAPTTAAARAHQWLGDRALTAGWPDEARYHFRKAIAAGSSEQQFTAAQRVALADYLNDGQRSTLNAGAPGDGQHKVADLAQLQQVLASSRPVRRAGSYQPPAAAEQTSPITRAQYRTVSRLAIGAPFAQRQGRPSLAQLETLGVDWPGRQISTFLGDDALYVSNRFQIQAIDLEGKLRWESSPATGREGLAGEWPLVPMRPLIVGDQLFTRMLVAAGPSLVCLDRHDGAVRWHVPSSHEREFAADPWWSRGRLLCLTVAKSEQSQLVLSLARLDPSTGALWQQKELITIDENWRLRRVCQVAVVGERAIVALGGLTFCIDASGRVRWLRREQVIPPDADPGWSLQTHRPPSSDGDFLWVAQPGVRSIACLSLETGTCKWHRVMPTIRDIVGVAGGFVWVRSSEGVVSLNAESGALEWRMDLAETSSVGMDPQSRWIVTATPLLNGTTEGKGVQLEWIDSLTGKTLQTALGEWGNVEIRENPCVSSVLLHDNDVWLVRGHRREPDRELIRYRSEEVRK